MTTDNRNAKDELDRVINTPIVTNIHVNGIGNTAMSDNINLPSMPIEISESELYQEDRNPEYRIEDELVVTSSESNEINILDDDRDNIDFQSMPIGNTAIRKKNNVDDKALSGVAGNEVDLAINTTNNHDDCVSNYTSKNDPLNIRLDSESEDDESLPLSIRLSESVVLVENDDLFARDYDINIENHIEDEMGIFQDVQGEPFSRQPTHSATADIENGPWEDSIDEWESVTLYHITD
jgi:hypothetical protein